MKMLWTPIACLVFVFLTARARGDEQMDRLVGDLRSPYLEVREAAADRLAAGGGEGARALRAAYEGADYRTKELILAAFGRSDPEAGVALVVHDLACPDRGVFRAQKELLSALYALPRNLVAAEILPGLPAGDGGLRDWELEEGLRALPTRVPAARKALKRFPVFVSPRFRKLGSRLRDLVAAVDRVRDLLATARESGDDAKAARARELGRHLLRHDVERLLFAVFQSGGREGAYEGMYRIVGELFDMEGQPVISDLMSILRDREPPEAWIPASALAPYRFLEPPPLDQSLIWIRRRAAYCIGDIGDRRAGLVLLRYYMDELKDLSLNMYDEPNVREEVAHACAALGQKQPLRVIVDLYSERYPDSDLLARLGAAHARLREWNLARLRFQEAVDEEAEGHIYALYNLACALSRMGRTGEALQALRSAVENGYGLDPSHLEWMERDGDLKAVRELPGYEDLVQDIKARLAR